MSGVMGVLTKSETREESSRNGIAVAPRNLQIDAIACNLKHLRRPVDGSSDEKKTMPAEADAQCSLSTKRAARPWLGSGILREAVYVHVVAASQHLGRPRRREQILRDDYRRDSREGFGLAMKHLETAWAILFETEIVARENSTKGIFKTPSKRKNLPGL
jgi:hypothetical protein